MPYAPALSLAYSCLLLATPQLSKMTLRAQFPYRQNVIEGLEVVCKEMQVGDWNLLHMLGNRLEPGVIGEVVVEMSKHMQDTIQKKKNDTEKMSIKIKHC